MAANGQKLRVAVTKTSAQGKAAQSATPNLMSFSSDENSIWFNGKKYGVYILKGFENLSTESNTGVIQSFLGDFTYDRWVDAVNTGNIVFVETNNILIPASVYANNSEDLNIMFVTLTYTYFVSIHYSTGSGYSINLIQQDSLVRVADVNNTLTNSSTDKPLSAAMGKKLQDEKLGKTDASNTYATKSDLSSHTDNKNNPHGVTKEQVGLSNVTNDAQVKRSEMGKAGGVATLDSGGKVPSAQLPSYVDDVLEVRDFVGGKDNIPTSGLTVGWLYYVTGEKKIYRATSATAVDGGSTPETGKIYVTADDNKTYRWSGSDLVEISKSIGLGETAGTAYDGKKGADLKKAYDAHAGNKSNPHGVTKEQVGLSNVTNDAQVKRSEVVDDYDAAKIGSANEVPSTNAFKKAVEYAEMFPVSFDAIETGTKTITQASATTPGGRVVWLDDMKKFAYKLNGSYYNNWSIPDSPNPALTNADLVKVLGTNGPIPGKCYITNGTLFFSTGSDLAYVANFTELSNSLSDSSTSKALTAAKGKQLQDEKLSKTDANNTYAKKADGISHYSIGELTALSSNPTQEQLKTALGTPSAFRNAIDAGELILVTGNANVQSQKSATCIIDSGNVIVKYLHPGNNDWTVIAKCVPASSGDNWDNAQFSIRTVKPSDSAGITIE